MKNINYIIGAKFQIKYLIVLGLLLWIFQVTIEKLNLVLIFARRLKIN